MKESFLFDGLSPPFASDAAGSPPNKKVIPLLSPSLCGEISTLDKMVSRDKLYVDG
jgi:hypothetical protein